jgi:ubiquinone/menaquinone biosynthesis C-methylase UbiE
MRRQALAPISRHLSGRRLVPNFTSSGVAARDSRTVKAAPNQKVVPMSLTRAQAKDQRHQVLAELRLLDLGCGTGRFLAQIKSNWPRLPVIGIDLSPHYLAEARERLASWSRVALVEGAAEALPFPEAHFDVVTSVYLLHELPRQVRHAALREMARVLKPGGLLIVADSLQRGDKPEYEAMMDHFPTAFHEPYYDDYTRDDLAAVLGRAGLTVAGVDLAYFSRIMRAMKPG